MIQHQHHPFHLQVIKFVHILIVRNHPAMMMAGCHHLTVHKEHRKWNEFKKKKQKEKKWCTQWEDNDEDDDDIMEQRDKQQVRYYSKLENGGLGRHLHFFKPHTCAEFFYSRVHFSCKQITRRPLNCNQNALKMHFDVCACSNSVLSVENALALQAWVEDDDNKNLSLSQKFWFKLHVSWALKV